MERLRWCVASLVVALLASAASAQDPTEEPAPEPAPAPAAPAKPAKGVGELAPRLTNVEWLLGKAVKQYARGTTYVVVFWAPWDIDSQRSLPLLAELQKRHAGQRVSVVAVVLTDRPEIVPALGYVQRNKAALPFLVATDVLDKTKSTWDAVVGTRMPLAVIVDRSGRIAWAGHPLNGLDQALAAVVADDKAALEKVLTTRRDVSDRMNPLVRDLQKYVGTDGMEKRCCELVDGLLAIDSRLAAPWLRVKYDGLRKLGQADEAAAWGRRLASELLHDDAVLLNDLAWSIVDPQARVAQPDIELAALAAERSNELTGGQDSAILDTLARVRWLQGQHDQAVTLQGKAIELAWTADMRKGLQKTLTEYTKPAAPAGN